VAAGSATDRSPDQRDVERLVDAFGSALEARDAAGMLATLAEDAVIIPSEGVTAYLGREAVDAFIHRLEHHARRYGWRWTERRVVVRGDAAWFVALGRENVEEDRREWTLPYCLTGAAVRTAAGWRLQMLHASEDRPARPKA